jgi:Carboxypeptidase regulatory-like domain
MLGDDMKRISIVVILMLALAVAACSSTSSSSTTNTGPTGTGPTTSGPTGTGPTGTGPTTSGPTGTGPTDSGPTDSGYYTVSGQIVHQDTEAPYPNAYVRFEWLVNASYERETHTVTDGSGRYSIQLPAGQYQLTAGDSCDLNAGFAIVGKAPDDVMITVPGTSEVDFVEYPITPGADIPGAC